MKRIIALTLAALCLGIAGCADSGDGSSQEGSSQNSSAEQLTPIEEVQRDIGESGSLCAMANIGYCDSSDFGEISAYIAQAAAENDMPYLTEIPEEQYVMMGGGELYVVIPRDEGVSVTVSEWLIDESNDFSGARGEDIYYNNLGEPLILMCNVSDIMPNSLVTLEENGSQLSFTPYMSLKDGSMVTAESGVLDITKYPFPLTAESE